MLWLTLLFFEETVLCSTTLPIFFNHNLILLCTQALQYDSAATSVAEADVSAQQGNDKKMRSEKPQTSNTVDSSIPPIEGLIAQKLSLLDDEIRLLFGLIII